MYDVRYKSNMGSLMYAMVCTRPNITSFVGCVFQYLSNPGLAHWSSVKRIFKYLKSTSNLGLFIKEDLLLYQIKFKDIQMLTRLRMLIIKDLPLVMFAC
jgi:hypothetical protein